MKLQDPKEWRWCREGFDSRLIKEGKGKPPFRVWLGSRIYGKLFVRYDMPPAPVPGGEWRGTPEQLELFAKAPDFSGLGKYKDEHRKDLIEGNDPNSEAVKQMTKVARKGFDYGKLEETVLAVHSRQENGEMVLEHFTVNSGIGSQEGLVAQQKAWNERKRQYLEARLKSLGSFRWTLAACMVLNMWASTWGHWWYFNTFAAMAAGLVLGHNIKTVQNIKKELKEL